MSKKKAHIDAKIQQANIDKSIIVLLTGNGKGKTTSALGMVLRSLGWGQKIVWVSFLKGEIDSGEKHFLSQHPQIKYIEMTTGFTWESQNKELDTQNATQTWQQTHPYLQDDTIDLIVLDELTYMLNYHYLDNSILNKITARLPKQNVIITGRAANDSLKNIADTISIINNEKHAFDNNIQAKKGIDF
jgi:cob(I)alamin adenosyltransferase